jgi:hypothetical protein
VQTRDRWEAAPQPGRNEALLHEAAAGPGQQPPAFPAPIGLGEKQFAELMPRPVAVGIERDGLAIGLFGLVVASRIPIDMPVVF